MSVTLRRKNLKGGRKSLYLDIYEKGERWTETLDIYLEPGSNNKEKTIIAELIRNKRETDLINNKTGGLIKHKGEVLLTDAFESFKKAKKRNGKSKTTSTLQTYDSAINYINSFDPKIKLNQVDDVWLSKFKSYLFEKVGHNSAVVYFSVLDALMNHSVKQKAIFQNPSVFIDKARLEQNITQDLSEEELIELKKTPCKNEELKRAFFFGCFTGLRVSDIRKLTFGDLEYSKNFGCRIKVRQTKTTEPIYLPISENALEYVGQGEKIDRIFKGKLNDSYSNIILRMWFLEAGITKKSKFHLARHTTAVLLGTFGEDIFTISQILGHSSVDFTAKKYGRVIDKRKIEAVNKLPKI